MTTLHAKSDVASKKKCFSLVILGSSRLIFTVLSNRDRNARSHCVTSHNVGRHACPRLSTINSRRRDRFRRAVAFYPGSSARSCLGENQPCVFDAGRLYRLHGDLRKFSQGLTCRRFGNDAELSSRAFRRGPGYESSLPKWCRCWGRRIGPRALGPPRPRPSPPRL
jgi:transposase